MLTYSSEFLNNTISSVLYNFRSFGSNTCVITCSLFILNVCFITEKFNFSRLRQEMEIKLKKEEEDRQLRRKRVEAIMLRTRNQGKGSSNASTKVCFKFYKINTCLN